MVLTDINPNPASRFTLKNGVMLFSSKSEKLISSPRDVTAEKREPAF